MPTRVSNIVFSIYSLCRDSGNYDKKNENIEGMIIINKPLNGLGEQGKGHLFQGNICLILREQGENTILGNRGNMKTTLDFFWRSGEQANLFQGNTGTGTTLGVPQ